MSSDDFSFLMFIFPLTVFCNQSECNSNSPHWLSQCAIVISTALYHSIDVSVTIIRSVVYPLWSSVGLEFNSHVLPVRVDIKIRRDDLFPLHCSSDVLLLSLSQYKFRYMSHWSWRCQKWLWYRHFQLWRRHKYFPFNSFREDLYCIWKYDIYTWIFCYSASADTRFSKNIRPFILTHNIRFRSAEILYSMKGHSQRKKSQTHKSTEEEKIWFQFSH